MKSQARLLKEISGATSLVRGRVYTMKQTTKDGGKFFNLQYTKGGKHVVKYIPSDSLAAYETATENYRRLMELVDAYVAETSERTMKAIERNSEDGRKKRNRKV